MTFIWLENLVQNSTLVEEVGESCHMHGVEQVDFQEDFVSHMIAEERHALNQRDVADIC